MRDVRAGTRLISHRTVWRQGGSWARASSSRQLGGGTGLAVGKPVREWLLGDTMRSRRRVLLVQSGQLLGREAIREPRQCGPQTAMHECDLAVDQPQANDIGRIVECPQDVEDRVPLRMPPPASLDRLTGDQFGNIGDRSPRRLQQHAVLDQRGHDICCGIHGAILSHLRLAGDRRIAPPTIRR